MQPGPLAEAETEEATETALPANAALDEQIPAEISFTRRSRS